MNKNEMPEISDFPLTTSDKIRYCDTDRQGHINNAVFLTFLETGRVELLYNPEEPLTSDGGSFVIASLKLDFFHEITWPGEIRIGTKVTKIGRSSMTFEQGLFQNEICTARAESVIVHIDEATRKSMPLGKAALAKLKSFM